MRRESAVHALTRVCLAVTRVRLPRPQTIPNLLGIKQAKRPKYRNNLQHIIGCHFGLPRVAAQGGCPGRVSGRQTRREHAETR